MAHTLARAFEKARRIFEPGAKEKPDIDVLPEGIDLAESSIPDASPGMAVVQELAHVVAEVPHEVEPRPRHAAEVERPRLEARALAMKGRSARRPATRVADGHHLALA